MPLTLFDHQSRTVTVENDSSDHKFEHFFGGAPEDYGQAFRVLQSVLEIQSRLRLDRAADVLQFEA